MIAALSAVPNNEMEQEIRRQVTETYVIGDAIEVRTAFEAFAEAAEVAARI